MNSFTSRAVVFLGVLAALDSAAQDFVNNDLEGAAAGTSVTPPGWTNVPFGDPVCEATANYAATPDLTDINGPVYSNGIMGNPYSGLVFMCGLYGAGYHEGIMQTVSGFTVGCGYTIGFYQTVVKQSSTDYLDETGTWMLYADNTLIGESAPTFSAEPPISLNKPWEFRTITFVATAATHTIKFLPGDDDADQNPPEGLRMGIDSIFIQTTNVVAPGAFLGPDATICPGGSVLLDPGQVTGATYLWQDGSTGTTFTATNEGEYYVDITLGCATSTDTIQITEFDPAVFDLGPDATLCDGTTLVLDATTTGATYVWQDGATDPTYSVSVGGTYSVDVTLGGCTASDAITVAFDPVPVVDLGPDANLCTGGVLVLDATYPGASYLWQDGATSATYDASAGGTFSVDVTVGGCTASDAIDVVVNTPPDAGSDGAVTLCSTTGTIFLLDQLGGIPGDGGVWTAPDGAPHNGFFDTAVDAPGSYLYTIVGVAPCPADDATVVVDVITAPDPGTGGTLTLCSTGSAAALLDNMGGTPDAGGAWSDPFGNPVDGTFDPATDPAGSYTYSFQPAAPCVAVSAIVDVALVQALDPGTDGTADFCAGDAAAPLFGSLGGTPDAPGTWTAPGGGAFAGVFNPAVHAAGNYTYTVNPGAPCPAASAVVTVTNAPAANAGPDAALCDLDHDLAALGTWDSGSWSGPAGIAFADASAGSTTVTATTGGTFTLTWTITSTTGCISTDDVQVTFADPIVPTVATVAPTCNGDCDATASASATGGNPAPGGYDFAWAGGIGGNTPAVSDLCAGTYTVTITDANGCTVDQAFTIDDPPVLAIAGVITTPETCPGTCDGTATINDAQGVAFSIDGGATFQASGAFIDLCAGDLPLVMVSASGCQAQGIAQVLSPAPVVASFVTVPGMLFVDQTVAQFTNTSSSNAISFAWDLAGLDSSTLENPSFTFPQGEPQTLTICLAVADANGCADTTCAELIISDRPVVHVPNAFTPNTDGINDGFGPVVNVPWIVDYSFMVFNRWGERIFSSEQPGQPWDGTYGGALVQDGVYVWKLTWRDPYSTKDVEAVGHVTVLR